MAKEVDYDEIKYLAPMVANLVRRRDTDDSVRVSNNCQWVATNIWTLETWCQPEHLELLTVITDLWKESMTAPSVSVVKEFLKDDKTFLHLDDLLDTCLEASEDPLTADDYPHLQMGLEEEWRKRRLQSTWKQAKQIIISGLEDPKTHKVWSGAQDAERFLMKQLEFSPVGTGSSQPTSGDVTDLVGRLQTIYNKNEEDRRSGNLGIPIGIPEIESAVMLKPGDLVGILGFPGQRKSSLCRSMTYNAVMAGRNVRYTSLEQTIDEEVIFFAMIHSKNPKFNGSYDLSKRKFDRGELTVAERDFLYNDVIPDIRDNKLPGRLIFDPGTRPEWPALKASAEICQAVQCPLDMWVIDYIAVGARGGKDETAMVNSWIRDCKQSALHWADEKGLVIVTPLQGNREGHKRASERGGVWDMQGVYQYSEAEKTFDTILSVYMDVDEGTGFTTAGDLTSGSELIISSAKLRRGAPISPFKVSISDATGALYLGGSSMVATQDLSKMKLPQYSDPASLPFEV